MKKGSYSKVLARALPVYIVGLTIDENWFDTAIAENKVCRVVERAQNMRPYLHEVRVQIEKQRTGGNLDMVDRISITPTSILKQSKT